MVSEDLAPNFPQSGERRHKPPRIALQTIRASYEASLCLQHRKASSLHRQEIPEGSNLLYGLRLISYIYLILLSSVCQVLIDIILKVLHPLTPQGEPDNVARECNIFPCYTAALQSPPDGPRRVCRILANLPYSDKFHLLYPYGTRTAPRSLPVYPCQFGELLGGSACIGIIACVKCLTKWKHVIRY